MRGFANPHIAEPESEEGQTLDSICSLVVRWVRQRLQPSTLPPATEAGTARYSRCFRPIGSIRLGADAERGRSRAGGGRQ